MPKTISEQILSNVGNGRDGLSSVRFTSAVTLFNQGTPATCNATATMTAADVLAGIVTSTSAAAVAATLPLATDLEVALLALFPSLALDDSYDFSFVNTGTNIVTMTTNTGWTLVGDMTIAPLTAGDESSAIFRARRVSSTAYTLYRLT